MFGFDELEAGLRLTIVAPEDSLAQDYATLKQIRCIDTRELVVPIEVYNKLYVTERRSFPIYNDMGMSTYTSSNETVLSIDSNGYMTAVSAGDVQITVTVDGREYVYDYVVVPRTQENVLDILFYIRSAYLIIRKQNRYLRLQIFTS